MRSASKKHVKNGLTYIALIIIILLVNIPFFQIFSVSFKSRQEALSSARFFPERISVASFINVMGATDFPLNLRNSIIASLSSTFFCIIIAVIAGYALSRFKGKIFSGYAMLLLVLQLFPSVLLLIPLFVIFSGLGLVDNLLSVILAYTTVNLAFSIWMIKGFMDTIPFDLEEAAMIVRIPVYLNTNYGNI